VNILRGCETKLPGRDLALSGTCRELVLTRDDARQHRAFFRFL
jgi:hypothetical protein